MQLKKNAAPKKCRFEMSPPSATHRERRKINVIVNVLRQKNPVAESMSAIPFHM